MTARVRPATVDDVPRLAEIEGACFGAQHNLAAMAEELERAWARVLVVEADGGVAAYVTLWRVADEAEIIQVGTHPTQRRSGHARRAMESALALAQEMGLVRVLLEVRPSNVGAVALYQALGFCEIARRERYYDDGEDAMIMSVALG